MAETEKLVPRRRFKEFINSGAWGLLKLSEIATMHARIGWQNLRTSEFLDSGEYMLITGTDFEDGAINYSTCHYIEKRRYDQDTHIQIDNGSILITKDGTLGKVAYVQDLTMPATLNAGVFNIKIKDERAVDRKYLFQYLKAPYLMDYVEKKATGGTIKHLNQNILVDFPVVLPGKAEQIRVGDYLSHIDYLITLHQHKVKKIKALKSAYLSEMFPVEGECKPKRRFAGFTEEWEQRKLGEVCSEIGDGLHSAPIYDECGDYFFINGNNLVNGKVKINLEETPKVSKETFQKNDKGLDDSTLLLSINGTIGNIAYYRGELIMLGKSAAYLKCNLIDKTFLFTSLQTNTIINKFMLSLTGTTIKNLGLESIKNTVISLPPKEEQHRLGQYFTNLDNLITLHQRKLEKLQNIKKAFLNEMFI